MSNPKIKEVDWGDGTKAPFRQPDYRDFPDKGKNSDPFCRTAPCDLSAYEGEEETEKPSSKEKKLSG
jgi:hypothetical protein